MNAEKLNDLLYELSAEYTELGLQAKLQKFLQTYSQSVTQPNQQTSTAFIAAKAALEIALDTAESNELPPSRLRILEKMNALPFVGRGLFKSLETILKSNNSTPGQGVDQITEFNKTVIAFYTMADQTHKNLKQMGIEYDFTDKEEYEVGALFPSEVFKNSVEGLARELCLLDQHMKTFGEIAGHDTSSPTIRSTADGSFELFLNALPEVAAAIGEAIEKIVLVYLGILQIRQLREEAKKKHMPDEVTKLMEKHEKEVITAEIDKIANEIFKKYRKKPEKHRDKELHGHLVRALTYMAKRIDAGADFEVSPPSVEPDIAQDASEAAKTKQEKQELVRKELQLRGTAAKRLPTRTKPILALPDPHEKEKDDKP